MKNIFKALLVVIIIAFAGQANAQNKITGRVFSEPTDEPLSKVNVIVESDGSLRAVTDDEGRFSFDIGKSVSERLLFRRIGYTEQEALWIKGSPLSIYLKEEIPTSEEIIVNESLSGEDMLNSFYINSGLNSVEELLSYSPGMTLTKRGNFAAEPVIRGMNTDRMSITLNGMKIQSACTDKMDPVTSYAETGNLKSVTVSKGAFGEEECASSCSGIDMKLKEAETTERFSLKGGFNGGFLSVSKGTKLEGRVDLSSSVFGSTFGATYRASGDYKDGNGDVIPYSGYNKINVSNSSVFRFNSDNSITADFLYDYAWDVGYPALTMDVSDAEAFITGVQYNSRNVSSLISDIEGRVYYNNVTHTMDDSQRDNRIKMDMPGWTNTTGAYLKTGLDLGGTMLDVKADASVMNANAEMTMYIPGLGFPMYMVTWPDVRKKDLSLSAGGNVLLASSALFSYRAWGGNINSDVRSEIGLAELRIFYPDFDGHDNRFAGGFFAGIETQLARNIQAGVNYSFNKRSLTVSEQFAFYIFNRFDSYDYIGDPYLLTETSNQLELNSIVNIGSVNIETSLFGYFIGDYIVGKVDSTLSPMTENSNGVKFYTNIPSAKILGFEQTADISLSNSVRIINNIQYTYGTDNSGAYLPQMPPLMGNLSARYTGKDFLVQGETVWGAAQNDINAEYGESTTPSYIVFNLRGSLSLASNLSIDAGIENLLNANYYEHLDWEKIPRPGRNIYVSLKTGF